MKKVGILWGLVAYGSMVLFSIYEFQVDTL